MWYLLSFIIWFQYNPKSRTFSLDIVKKIQVAFETRQFFSWLICMYTNVHQEPDSVQVQNRPNLNITFIKCALEVACFGLEIIQV